MKKTKEISKISLELSSCGRAIVSQMYVTSRVSALVTGTAVEKSKFEIEEKSDENQNKSKLTSFRKTIVVKNWTKLIE